MKRLGVAVSILVVALVASLLVRVAIVESEDPLVVVQWSNSHPLREGLLEDMAERFNDEGFEAASGQPIEIKVVECDSADQVEDVVARVTDVGEIGACKDDGQAAEDPTIITPQSDDWFTFLNHLAKSVVVDPGKAKPLAEAYLGIVTYSAMAQCLTSSNQSIGYQDVLELAERGWAAAGCKPKSSWGTYPRLSFTNPSTSTSGRNVLLTLYAMYAGGAAGTKALDQLSEEDVARADVQDRVRDFQGAVDHYMNTTPALNTQIADEGAEFFLLPEDNVVSLYKGLEERRGADGKKEDLKIQGLKMLYPEEGSVLNSNPAGIVDASWVDAEQRDAANTWIDYLREEEQQRDFMAAGFRPAHDTGLGLHVDAKQYGHWGLDAQDPEKVIDPAKVRPQVLDQIIASWGAVKKPSVVTFVVDLSNSMGGTKVEQVQDGLRRIIDEMEDAAAESSKVGLVTFSSAVNEPSMPPARLADVGKDIGDAITAMEGQVKGNTALYDAIARAVDLTDRADAPPGATRAVVVLSDGQANAGRCLDRIVNMAHGEDRIATYCGRTDDQPPRDENGAAVSPHEVDGLSLAQDVAHDDLRVFFVGFGQADVNVGRILAGATKADFQTSTEDGLAAVIEALSGYF
ncbi:MAG: extracellular solute-binding protein [Acidimicrobiales bacterium]